MSNCFSFLTCVRKSLRSRRAQAVASGPVFGALLALAVCGAARAGATTISFQEGVSGYSGTRDTILYSPAPDTNEALTYLAAWEIGATVGGNSARSLIGFDLSSVAPGTIVNSATLTLYQDAAQGSLNQTNSLYVVDGSDKAWTTTGATWNNLNGTGPVAWTGGPGLAAGTDYGAAVASAVSPATVQNVVGLGLAMPLALYGAGITALQDWINHPGDNSGFFLRQPYNTNSEDSFSSSSASNSSLHPLLTLDVTLVPEPASWVLFGLSSVGLLLAARRRRKA